MFTGDGRQTNDLDKKLIAWRAWWSARRNYWSSHTPTHIPVGAGYLRRCRFLRYLLDLLSSVHRNSPRVSRITICWVQTKANRNIGLIIKFIIAGILGGLVGVLTDFVVLTETKLAILGHY